MNHGANFCCVLVLIVKGIFDLPVPVLRFIWRLLHSGGADSNEDFGRELVVCFDFVEVLGRLDLHNCNDLSKICFIHCT